MIANTLKLDTTECKMSNKRSLDERLPENYFARDKMRFTQSKNHIQKSNPFCPP